MMAEVIGRARRFGLRGELESWRLLAEERERKKRKEKKRALNPVARTVGHGGGMFHKIGFH